MGPAAMFRWPQRDEQLFGSLGPLSHHGCGDGEITSNVAFYDCIRLNDRIELALVSWQMWQSGTRLRTGSN
jgi:hypothetical protein